MDAEIIKLEVLLDKVNLLFSQIKADGKLDNLERMLLQKYLKEIDAIIQPDKLVSKLSDAPVIPDPQMKMPEQVIENIPEEKREEPVPVKQIAEEMPPVVKQVEVPKVEENKKPPEKEKTVDPVRKPLVQNMEDDAEDTFNTGLNSRIKEGDGKKTLADKLNKVKSKDLRSLIDLNARILITRRLFANDKDAYESAIKQINGMQDIAAAQAFMQGTLSEKYQWKDADAIAQFMELVQSKFS